MKRNICLGGVTGKVGREVAAAILSGSEFTLSGGFARGQAGRPLGELLGLECGDRCGGVIWDSLEAALEGADIYIDYTAPEAVKRHAETALNRGIHVVAGTSGLTDEEYAELGALAASKRLSLFAAGNFSITASLMQYFAKIAAGLIPSWEILDYGSAQKRDAPSGTSRELAFHLGKKGAAGPEVPPERVAGLKESRGASLNGSQIHSLRLPGFYSSSEIIFGLPGERLALRHDAISPAPYVAGTLLAARACGTFTGLKRGLESIMNFS